jgi:hypothetical protein
MLDKCRVRRAALQAVVLCVWPAVSCLGDEIQVPLDVPSIQGAVDAASSGDIISVAPGEYPGGLAIVGKSIEIRALVRGTVFVRASASRCMAIEGVLGGGVVLRGVTLVGGSDGAGGGGLNVVSSAVSLIDSAIIDCVVPSGGSGAGGGLSAVDSIIDLHGCVFARNRAESSAVTPAEVGFRVVARGGAIQALRSSVRAEGCMFDSNVAIATRSATWMEVSAAGGAICALNSYIDLSDCRFEGNQSMASASGFGPIARAFGGAIALSRDVGVGANVDRCHFVGNVVSASSDNAYYGGAGQALGGAISIGHYTATPGAAAAHSISRCAFVDQRAFKSPQSGESQVIAEIARWEGETANVSDCAFSGSLATQFGGSVTACVWNRGGSESALSVSRAIACELQVAFAAGPVSITETEVVRECPSCSPSGISSIRLIVGGDADANFDWIPDSCQCIGDLNADGIVHGADLGELLLNWGPAVSGHADLNSDGAVDGLDLAIVLGTWGPC